MTDPRLTELLNGEIDGELDRQQRAELSRRLLANTGARAAREDLRRVCEALDSVPQVEPPPALSENVLAALPQRVPLHPSPAGATPRCLGGLSAAGPLCFTRCAGGAPPIVRSPGPSRRP